VAFHQGLGNLVLKVSAADGGQDPPGSSQENSGEPRRTREGNGDIVFGGDELVLERPDMIVAITRIGSVEKCSCPIHWVGRYMSFVDLSYPPLSAQEEVLSPLYGVNMAAA